MNERIGILDGSGNGYRAKVNSSNQLHTRSVNISPLHDAALRGDAYAWNAVSANIDTTDCMLLVSNDSATRYLIIDHAYVRGDIAGQIDIKLAECAGLTLAGTAVVGVNLNRTSANIADATAFADETASPAATVIMTVYQHLVVNAQGTTSPMTRIDFDGGILLGEDKAFGMDTILEPAAGFEATAIGYFIDIP
jgi:hypothetical protein